MKPLLLLLLLSTAALASYTSSSGGAGTTNSPTFTGTVTATAINAGGSPTSLSISTTDNTSGSTGDMLFSTGNASVSGSGSGSFLFAEGNSLSTKGIRVYNKDAGINYGYTQVDYTGIKMPNNGSIITQVTNDSFYVGAKNGASGFSFGHDNGINTRGYLVDGPGDTYYIGGELSHGIYPFNRLYIGSGGSVFGAPVSDGVTYDPINTIDVRGAAGKAQIQITNTATGLTPASSGALFGIAADGKGTMRLPAPAVPSTASDACVAGTIAWDAGFVYVCVATNTWKRTALSTW